MIDVIKKVYPDIDSLTINLKLPTEAGVYMAVGATTNQNYKTAVGVGYLTIAPQTQNIKLKFKNSLPTGNKLSHKDAQTFEFGGKVIDSNSQEVSASFKTLYYGFNNNGKFITSKTPITEPGQYVETVATIGGNYQVAPIVRSYKVDKEVVTIKFDDAPADNVYTVEYDGQQHAVTAGVYDENDVRIADASIKYMNDNYNSTDAPVNAKTYQVMASYAGNKQYKKAVVYSRLVITQKQVIITADNQEITYGDKLPKLTYTVTDKDGNQLSEEEIAKLGTIKVVKEDSSTDKGEYELTVEIEDANDNYVYELATGTLTISKRKLTVEIDSKKKVVGEKDPKLTYTLTKGNLVNGDDLGLTLTREAGEEVGLYDIYTHTEGLNSNYEVEISDGKDKFEIVNKAVVVDTNKTNTSDKTHKKDKPSTGDETQIMNYVVSMMVTLFAIAVMVFLKREYLKK